VALSALVANRLAYRLLVNRWKPVENANTDATRSRIHERKEETVQESDLVYLIASFPDTTQLEQAVHDLAVPRDQIAVLGNEASGAAALAESLGLATELDSDTPLDEGQRERLEWNRKHHDRPLLAVAVPAEEGRDVRLHLTELGGEMLWAADVAEQVGDVDVEPGMITKEPPLPDGDELAFKRR